MAEINLSKYGITGTTEIVHNPSYEKLFEVPSRTVIRETMTVVCVPRRKYW